MNNMNVNEVSMLMKKYSVCPECGNEKVGGEPAEGAMHIKDYVFTRSCKCGWSVTEDHRIITSGSVTRKAKGKTTGVISITFRDIRKQKYVDMNTLKQMSGAKRSNQTKLIERWLNTKEGRAWAIDAADCSYFFDRMKG